MLILIILLGDYKRIECKNAQFFISYDDNIKNLPFWVQSKNNLKLSLFSFAFI